MFKRMLVGTAFAFAAASPSAAVTITFDDLPTPPAVTSATGLQFANGGSTQYQGVVWDARINVVGDAYRVDPPNGPLFGLPASGHYFVTNDGPVVNGQSTNDAIVLTTSMRLLGASFGRNEYYGFGAGADQVTIHALGTGGTILASLSFDLPETHPAQPEPLAYFDTSSFAGLAGIAGYRIDRRELGSQSGNWIADDFVFAPVPEPAQYALLVLGLPIVLRLAGRRRKFK